MWRTQLLMKNWFGTVRIRYSIIFIIYIAALKQQQTTTIFIESKIVISPVIKRSAPVNFLHCDHINTFPSVDSTNLDVSKPNPCF